jgi:hypothetical protein
MSGYEQYKKYRTAVIEFDIEGSEWHLVLTTFDIYIVSFANEQSLIPVRDVESPGALIEEMYQEVKENLEVFAKWQSFGTEGQKECENRLNDYRMQIARIEGRGRKEKELRKQIEELKFAKEIRCYSKDVLRDLLAELYYDGMRVGYELAKCRLPFISGISAGRADEYLKENMSQIRETIKLCEEYEKVENNDC